MRQYPYKIKRKCEPARKRGARTSVEIKRDYTIVSQELRCTSQARWHNIEEDSMVGAGDGKWALTGEQEAVRAQRANKMETKRRNCQREGHRLLDLVEWKTVSRVILVDVVLSQ